MLKSIAIIEAPSILGLQPTGVERLPDALVRAGLLGRLHARHAERVNAPAYSSSRADVTLSVWVLHDLVWRPEG